MRTTAIYTLALGMALMAAPLAAQRTGVDEARARERVEALIREHDALERVHRELLEYHREHASERTRDDLRRLEEEIRRHREQIERHARDAGLDVERLLREHAEANDHRSHQEWLDATRAAQEAERVSREQWQRVMQEAQEKAKLNEQQWLDALREANEKAKIDHQQWLEIMRDAQEKAALEQQHWFENWHTDPWTTHAWPDPWSALQAPSRTPPPPTQVPHVAPPAPKRVPHVPPAVQHPAPPPRGLPRAGAEVWRDLDRELDELWNGGPRASWAQEDPADSLWRAARDRLNRNDYRRAAELFGQIRTNSRYSRSVYRPDAYYYQAFALSRLGGEDNLRRAQEILGELTRRYAADRRHSDTNSLLALVQGALAQLGSENAAAQVRAWASEARTDARASSDARAAEEVQRALTSVQGVGSRDVSTTTMELLRNRTVAGLLPTTTDLFHPYFRGQLGARCHNDETEIQLIALNALVRMDSAAAMPVLREVMARRDECAPLLRERALQMVSRLETTQAETMLADAARNDPDPGVRQSALLWLASRNADRAITIAEQQLQNARNEEEQNQALATLARMRNERAWRIIRDYAARSDRPIEERRRAIGHLSSSNDSLNARFLRDLYTRVGDERQLKEAILMSSAFRRSADAEWLLRIAMDESEDARLREYAVTMASRARDASTESFARVYDRSSEKRVKSAAIRVLTDRARNDAAATEKLIAIARSETDIDLRKSAVLGLASVNDPRARELLIEILRR